MTDPAALKFKQERERYEAREMNLSWAHVPARERRLILAAHPGRCDDQGTRVTPEPLLETDALRLVRAFMAKRPATVTLTSGSAVPFAGDEVLLVLAGPRGVGKSIAACSALARREGRYVSAPELTKLDCPVATLKDAELLVVDDLGTEHIGASDFAPSRISDLLCTRYGCLAPTIITTNLLRPQFAGRYGERIDDRLNDGGRYVGLVGSSLRGRTK